MMTMYAPATDEITALLGDNLVSLESAKVYATWQQKWGGQNVTQTVPQAHLISKCAKERENV